jgi:hypothetical protein
MRRALLLFLAVLAIAPDVALAKGRLEKVVIRGPGITRPVTLTDPYLLRALAMGGLEDMGRITERPMPAPKVGKGFELARYVDDRLPGDAPVERAHYYPNPDGGPGYVFHHSTTGALRANWYDGQWFVATPNGDRAMRRVLARYDVRTKPAAATSGTGWPFVPIGAIALMAGLAIVVRRRRAGSHD